MEKALELLKWLEETNCAIANYREEDETLQDLKALVNKELYEAAIIYMYYQQEKKIMGEALAARSIARMIAEAEIWGVKEMLTGVVDMCESELKTLHRRHDRRNV